MWPEVKKVKDENRYELVLMGEDVNKKIEKEEGLDPDLYELTQLNFLRVSKSPLISISEKISLLANLTNLVLDGNKLESLSGAVGKLDKLKVLDLSRNSLVTLPEEIGQLARLTTLNVSVNKLTSLPCLNNCSHLALLDARENCLTEFPDVGHDSLALLADIKFARNNISEIPVSVQVLPSLKHLDLEDNSIKVVPGELIDCIKLKELSLKGNPLTDRRFRKLVESDRCLPKQVMDYVKQHCPKLQEGKGGGKGKKGKGGKGKNKDQDQMDELCNELRVVSLTEETPVVRVDPVVKDVRPYMVCCILQKIDLSGENFKKFISLQTKLHEGICEKRLAATIATHDLAKIKGPLKYTARDPKEIVIHPLIRGKEITAKALHEALQHEADAQRKQMKKNMTTGLHKYLHIVEPWNVWPCIEDSAGTVVSLPPITNSDNTKITEETTDVFIEVTSSKTLGKAKEVLDALLQVIMQNNLCPERNEGDKTIMTIQQVRVEDEDGKLRVLYPSRTDLQYENEKIRVVMPEK
ncbi:leucine-rich repeat-containing protein 47-like [Penaeus indicus]|uniref:leucine-rich repeat-containing protein 47-like n=1 Tax=Penaeus indicus TaxID=29960 RepID=UPI00300D644C